MPKFLFQGKYVNDGVKGLLKEGGSARRAVLEKAFQSLGGKLEGFYFAFGEVDVFVFGELPDNAAATALALTVSSSGTAVTHVTVLLTPEEVDGAVKKTPTFRAPGK